MSVKMRQLKLTYAHVKLQTVSGGNSPDPHPRGGRGRKGRGGRREGTGPEERRGEWRGRKVSRGTGGMG